MGVPGVHPGRHEKRREHALPRRRRPGGKLNVPGASIFHVKNGKVDSAREYIDLLALHRQLGADPQETAPSSDPA